MEMIATLLRKGNYLYKLFINKWSLALSFNKYFFLKTLISNDAKKTLTLFCFLNNYLM